MPSINEAFVQSTADIYAHHTYQGLRSRAQDVVAQSCLSFFESDIYLLIQYVYDRFADKEDKALRRRLLEICYDEATHEYGMIWPEVYLRHMIRPKADNVYTTHDLKYNNRIVSCLEVHQCWRQFWIGEIQLAGGPTLFSPMITKSLDQEIPDPRSRYLYRVFTRSSPGNSDGEIVESPARSRYDVLVAKNLETSAVMLYQHWWRKGTGGGLADDNLMSWTSSPLTAFSYARHKAEWRNPRYVYICVVDTRNFPRGQFARDVWLARYLMEYAPHPLAKDRFERLSQREDTHEDIGEYFSQGILSHRNRSCVVTLQDLINAGLYMLYPELKNYSTSHFAVANELRQRWSRLDAQPTSEHELTAALGIAQNCFQTFNDLELACGILLLKSRRMAIDTASQLVRPSEITEPFEVKRSEDVLALVDELKWQQSGMSTIEMLMRLFHTSTDRA